MKTFVTVHLLKNVDLVTQWKVEHFRPGQVEMPSDLARLCFKNGWAKRVKIAQQ